MGNDGENVCDECCYRDWHNGDVSKCCYLSGNRCIINEFEENWLFKIKR